MKLIDKDALVAEIERRRDLHYKYYMKHGAGSIAECKYEEDEDIISFINTLEIKEDMEHYELEEFAKIVRGNLTGISKSVQSLFEAKYQQLTGNKMYGGYKD